MKCPRCGAINDNNEQFCYNCGLRLETPTPSSSGEPTILIPPPPDPQGGPLPQQQPGQQGYPPSGYGTPAPPPPPAYGQPPYGSNQPPTYQPPYGSNQPPSYNQPQYGASPYGTQPLYQTVTTNSTAAIVSLICGILAWIIPVGILGIVAVVAGHMARGAIRRSNNTLGGGGMALAGLILGYLNILAAVLLCALIVIGLAVSSTNR